ncbi:proton-coupled zinc antiporter SLC30A2-like isoform X1 [Hypanus sabinus]|uniref:proton-coupled zinc antiporter SLC30A2-like isoform X1 n=1 Tax=Hypanus sabinus TaxID=79690 RepID=UPI0028C3A363|nr:proton-coupled zinc antiporter SLC30A2-like isoform X1 [Hypanus sabinus]
MIAKFLSRFAPECKGRSGEPGEVLPHDANLLKVLVFLPVILTSRGASTSPILKVGLGIFSPFYSMELKSREDMSETLPLLKELSPQRPCSSGGASSYVLYGSLPCADVTTRKLELWHCHPHQLSGKHRLVDQQIARQRLYVASVVCFVFIIAEVIGGYMARSLAVMTDAAHLLTDLASMLLSLFALWLSSRPATKTMNFGWYRSEILGALFSVLSIWLVTGVLVYLATERLISKEYDVDGAVMLVTSGCAVGINILMAIILHQSGHNHSHGHTRSHDLESNPQGLKVSARTNPSVRAAFIHVVGDLLQSFGVLIAAYIIYFEPEYKAIDPICTFLFSLLVLGTTFSILRDVLRVLMEGTPTGMDFSHVKETLLLIDGVKAVHSLHIWALTMNQLVLSVHIATNEEANAQVILAEANQVLQSKFDFHSITIQIESYSDDMINCRECQEPRD